MNKKKALEHEISHIALNSSELANHVHSLTYFIKLKLYRKVDSGLHSRGMYFKTDIRVLKNTNRKGSTLTRIIEIHNIGTHHSCRCVMSGAIPNYH